MSWSPQQQAMLGAMGYTLYRSAGPGEAFAVAPIIEPTRTPVRPDQLAEKAVHASAARPRAAAASDRLMQALVRAAGGRDPGQLPLPPLEQLRANAAAKRALWPALRALRRQR